MGLIEDLTTYVWNWLVYFKVASSLSCWMFGGWGLFWDNDNGELMNECFSLFSGFAVTFPVTYESAYATE